MYVMPSQGTAARPNDDDAVRMVIGPAFAAMIGLAMLTVVYRFDGVSMIQRAFHLSGSEMLLTCVVAYVVAAMLTAALGLLLGARFPTGVTTSAIGVMFIGSALTALAAGSGMLLVGRVLGGLGAGAVVGVTAALVHRLQTRRGTVAATVAALGVLAMVIAPVAGQLISDVVSYRVMYLSALPLLLIAMIVSAGNGIASGKRPARPLPYGTSYAPQGSVPPPNPVPPHGVAYPSQGYVQSPNQAPYGAAYPQQGPVQSPNPVPYGAAYPYQEPVQYQNPTPGTPYPPQGPSQQPNQPPQGMPYPPQAPPS